LSTPVGYRPGRGSTTGNGKAVDTITFADDGTFKATNLPYEMFLGNRSLPPSFDPATDRLDDTGTWQLSEASSDRHVIVRADFPAVPPFTEGHGERLESERRSDGGGALLLLVPYAPRFDDRYLYRKVGTPAPSAS